MGGCSFVVLKYRRGRQAPGRHFLGSGTGATPSLISCLGDNSPPADIGDGAFDDGDVGVGLSGGDPSKNDGRPARLVVSRLKATRKGFKARMMRRTISAISTSLLIALFSLLLWLRLSIGIAIFGFGEDFATRE